MIHRIASRFCRASAIIPFGVSKRNTVNRILKKDPIYRLSFYKLEIFNILEFFFISWKRNNELTFELR